MLSKSTEFQFITRLHALPTSHAVTKINALSAEKLKKHVRMMISLKHTSATLGFLHASLLQINKSYFLVAGPSGIGKSTYAQHLSKIADVNIIANDWVAVEHEGNDYFASDLNVSEGMKHDKRCPLSGVIFLTFADPLGRDAFAPNKTEFEKLLREAFDTATAAELRKLSTFWLASFENLPFCAVVPARRGNEIQITQTLRDVLDRAEWSRSNLEVGVVGTGAVGATLAFELGQLPFIRRVHLFNRSPEKAVGLALDMNQALANKGSAHPVFIAHTAAEAVFAESSAVFLAFRDEDASASISQKVLAERWQKLPGHLPIIADYAALASRLQYNGALFVMTNPVDILTYALFIYSQQRAYPLKTYQLFGVGLELDAMRALSYGHAMGVNITDKGITLYGNHADTYALSVPLPKKQQQELLAAVKGSSQEIRKYVPRTIYGPAMAAIASLKAYYLGDASVHLCLIHENTFMGRRVAFRHGLPMLADSPEPKSYATLLETNISSSTALSETIKK